jgi:hypothetical protein
MPVIRGSTHGLYGIKEATFGVTPATPTMKETPFTTFGMRAAHGVMRSEQIRSHPFVDRVLRGRDTFELSLGFELQGATHDYLVESIFGSVIATKTMKYVDALGGLTLESRTGAPSSLFNQFTGCYFNRLDVSASASDTAPVTCTLGGMARTGALDTSATMATANTAAPDLDPYVFADASLTVNGVNQDIVSGSFTIERAVDPLVIWGNRQPREFVAGAVTATGTIMVPYDDDTISDKWEAFADLPLVFRFENEAGTAFRQFTFHRTRFTTLGRTVDTRAGLMQEVGWEAMYQPGGANFLTYTTE